MINNVQFTGNPAQKGIKVATDAMESFAQSRQQIVRPAANKVSDFIPQDAKITTSVAKINADAKKAAAVKLDDEFVARANSYAISHGTPEGKVVTGKIDYLA